jgi:lipopolysaccharide transport system ATP-binding protein
MHDVSRGGRTVLFISHNMSAVTALCSRAIVLDGGRVIFDGTAADGIRHYLAKHLDQSTHSWPLDRLARRDSDLGQTARLLEASAVTPRSEGYAFGEPLRLRVAIASSLPMADVVCALNVDDITGYRLVTFESPIGSASRNAARGRCELEVTVPPFGLRPGKYLLSASLFSGGQYYDYLVHFGVLTILPFEAGATMPFDDQPDRGPIKAPAIWRVVERQQAVPA